MSLELGTLLLDKKKIKRFALILSFVCKTRWSLDAFVFCGASDGGLQKEVEIKARTLVISEMSFR